MNGEAFTVASSARQKQGEGPPAGGSDDFFFFPSVLTALQVRSETVKEAWALLPEEQKYVLLYSSSWLTAAYL